MYTRNFIDLDPDSLRNPIAVVGFPGIGSVGKIAVETLASVLNAQRVMEFFSKESPSRILVKNGISHLPRSEMYFYDAAPDESSDLIMLTADAQPSSDVAVYEYADYIAKEFNRLGVHSVYALAAYEMEYDKFFSHYPAPPRIFVSASSESLRDQICKLSGLVAIEKGVITGANGVVPAYASTIYNMDGVCLLGETLGMIRVDYRAAQKLLEKFVQSIGLRANFEILDGPASKVIEIIEWADKEIQQGADEMGEDETPPDRYIG